MFFCLLPFLDHPLDDPVADIHEQPVDCRVFRQREDIHPFQPLVVRVVEFLDHPDIGYHAEDIDLHIGAELGCRHILAGMYIFEEQAAFANLGGLCVCLALLQWHSACRTREQKGEKKQGKGRDKPCGDKEDSRVKQAGFFVGVRSFYFFPVIASVAAGVVG
jgi:hypothetical protein